MQRHLMLALLLSGLTLFACECDDDPAPSTQANNGDLDAGNNGADAANNGANDTGNNGGPDAELDVPTTGAYMAAKEAAIGEVVDGLGLKYPVHVTRDELGIPHIMGESIEDVMVAQGYIHGVDRFAQMELIRSSVNGTISRVAGVVAPDTVEDDLRTRVLAFRFMAQKILDSIAPDSLEMRVLVAYTAGVNAFIAKVRDGSVSLLPEAGLLISPTTLTDWDVLDSLAVVRYQQYSLSFDSDREMSKTRSRMAAEATFAADATDPALAARAGILADLDAFAPADPTWIVPGFVGPGQKPELPGAPSTATRWQPPRREVLDNAIGFFDGLHGQRNWLTPDGRGLSNSWAITGALSTTGNAILANDPHLSMDSPALFHEIHLVNEPRTADDGPALNVFGFIFPGLPGVLIGHNANVAWGLTTASYDYSDVYVEELVWTDGERWPKVRHNGELIDVEVREETVEVGGFGSISETLVVELAWVPGHGPLVPTIVGREVTYPRDPEGISWAWTGYGVSNEVRAILGFALAEDMNDVRDALQDWVVGTQNMLFADLHGDVFQTGHSLIPTRPAEAMDWDPETNPGGNAPWWALRGTGEHDWNGQVPLELVPNVLNPESGYVVTANNDQTGVTADNNPLNDYAYIGYDYADGFRAGRIKRRLANEVGEFEDGHKFTAEEVGAIQYDIHSNFGERFTPFLLETLARALEELDAPGTHPDIAELAAAHSGDRARLEAIQALLGGWSFEAEDGIWGEPTEAQRAASAATSFFNVWATFALVASFEDEVRAAPGLEGGGTRYMKTSLVLLEHPTEAATFDAETGESALWDDLATADVKESHHAIFLKAFFEAWPKMTELFGSESQADWLWGKVHTRVFEAILPSLGGVSPLTVPQPSEWPNGFPRGGDTSNVNRCDGGLTDFRYDCGGGSILHFVVELDPAGIKSFNTIPGGEVWDYNSPHFRDLLELWLNSERHPIHFHPADVGAHVDDHAVLVP